MAGAKKSLRMLERPVISVCITKYRVSALREFRPSVLASPYRRHIQPIQGHGAQTDSEERATRGAEQISIVRLLAEWGFNRPLTSRPSAQNFIIRGGRVGGRHQGRAAEERKRPRLNYSH